MEGERDTVMSPRYGTTAKSNYLANCRRVHGAQTFDNGSFTEVLLQAGCEELFHSCFFIFYIILYFIQYSIYIPQYFCTLFLALIQDCVFNCLGLSRNFGWNMN